MSQELPEDLQYRILALLDGSLDEEEVSRLDADLRGSREARELFHQLATLHSALEEQGVARTGIGNVPIIPIERLMARQRRRVVKLSLLATAAVALVSAVAMWMLKIPDTPASLAGFRTAPDSVFMLSHSGEGEKPVGDMLAEGSRIVLKHGVVELDLPHDVRAVIESPAAITLVDERTLQLDHGRGFFQVSSEEGRGFTVRTPQQQIVDLGTAFGIDARSQRDAVELHVFEGRVRVDHLDGTEGETIAATRSVRLAGARVDRDLDGPPAAFFRQLPAKVETLLLEDFESGLVAGRDYAVQIEPTAIRDLAGNYFRGIGDNTTWNFTTASDTAQTPAVPLVITPTDEVATSQFGDWIDTIDGTGLSSGGTSGDILSETHAAGGGGNFAMFPGGPDFTGETITFALGARSRVDRVHLWLDNSVWGEITGFDLEFSTDGGTTFPTTVGGITFDGAAADLTQVQTRIFAEQSGVTHIRLSNVVVTGGNTAYAGFNEIRFGFEVVSDTTPPTLAGSEIVDGQGGGTVNENTLVTFTVTFSEDIDETTVSAADFGNAGTSPVNFGAISETAPGVFAVAVTPTAAGTLQLQIPAGASILDPADNPLDTAAAIVDDGIINVVVAPPDTTAPTPNPMSFRSAPAAISATLIMMEATAASDAAGVEYLFTETSGNPGGDSSGWQGSPTYEDRGLTTGLVYTYTVTARDLSAKQNATAPSAPASATARSRGDGLEALIGPDKPVSTGRDESPPLLMTLHPADDATYAMSGGRLAMVFNEPVKLGSGRFFIWNLSSWSETTLTVGDRRLSVDGRVLSITPPAHLAEGGRRIGTIAGWETGAAVEFLNPRGDGTWYADEDLEDNGRGRGTIGAMRGPLMATFGSGGGIRREFATLAADSRYTVSAAIGVRDGKAKQNATFLGYTIRLVSGDTILAELSDDTPPGPPNSVTSVGFSWDSSTLPEGLAPGAPLAIEIAPKNTSGADPGYLDLDNVRVTVVGE